ncbi:MAG: hypothetical protein BWY08_00303 [Bacteroidetes bacterium ADurb.Bin174]|jgi:hypothetical protein|nr:MAG: hypothetical protein BWY08_00303 [Bacteroidetes bacterium ADurb.Bin174]
MKPTLFYNIHKHEKFRMVVVLRALQQTPHPGKLGTRTMLFFKLHDTSSCQKYK